MLLNRYCGQCCQVLPLGKYSSEAFLGTQHLARIDDIYYVLADFQQPTKRGHSYKEI